MADVVGIYVRVAGIWERVNGGTPIGYSGPQVRQAGNWENVDIALTYTTFWRGIWANIDGEIGVGNLLIRSEDFSAPALTKVQYWINSNGSIDGQAIPGSPASRSSISTWRQFDVGREYEARFEEVLSGSFVAWDNHPGLNVWGNLTDPATGYTYDYEVSSQASRENRMIFKVREKVTAPFVGHDQGNHDTFLDSDTN